MNYEESSIKKCLSEAPNFKFINFGAVRNVYMTSNKIPGQVIKEWKLLSNKEVGVKLLSQLAKDEHNCQSFFGKLTRVIPEIPINEKQWSELNYKEKAFIRTIQTFISPTQQTSYPKNMINQLLKYVFSQLLKVGGGESILFPDLNIANFVITQKEICLIDSSSYIVSIERGEHEFRRIEDVLDKYLVLSTTWTNRTIPGFLKSSDFITLEHLIKKRSGIKYSKELFEQIYKGNLLYWK